MFERRIKPLALVIFSLLVTAGPTPAQEGGTGSSGTTGTAQAQPRRSPKTIERHKFWDAENVGLFAGVAVTRALDFTSTQHFRQRGLNEILLTNRIADNKTLFAGIEAAGTAASIGIAYWLHHMGHHRAERWVSIVHIGGGAFGDIRNYGLSNPQLTGTIP
jgi:hypothetical protein